jgi:type IV pilus assembly protein PilQ
MRWIARILGAILLVCLGAWSTASGLDRPQQQVLIEVRIVEVSRTMVDELGFRMPFTTLALTNQQTRSVTLVNSDGEGRFRTNLEPGRYSGRVFVEDLRVGPQWTALDVFSTIVMTYNGQGPTQGLPTLADFLSHRDLSRILSAPKLTTLNNGEARIQTGVRIPTRNIDGGGTVVEFVDNGLRLEVTPEITPDGHLIMNFRPVKNGDMQVPVNPEELSGGGGDGGGGDGGN